MKSFITKNGHSIFQALSEVDMMSGSQKNFFNLKRMPPGFYKQDSTKETFNSKGYGSSIAFD